MNTRNLLVSVLVLVCVMLPACAPAATPTVPTPVPAAATAAPTGPISGANAIAALPGTYISKADHFNIWLRSDGTFTTPAGSGVFTATPEQITFADTLPASGTHCSSEPGIYKWSWDNNKLTFVPIKENCVQRANALGNISFDKVQDDSSMPVEFLWRITGAPNDFSRPTGIAVDSQSNIYIVDGGNHRIQKFDTNGKFLNMWGSKGDGDGQFVFRVFPDHFGAVAVDGAGNVYVTDYNSRVQKFDSNGKFLMKWGSPGSGDGQFASESHMSIAVDAPGNVYVADSQASRIQKFDSNGKFLLKWGGKGNGDGEFGDSQDLSGPAGIAADGQGDVYVADPANYRIEKFDANGKFLSQWGSKGTGDGQFLLAEFVAVDQKGNVYVTDNQQNVDGPTNRVLKFDSNGKFLSKWGSTGTEVGMFNYPGATAVDKQGNIYVVNVEEDVQKFQLK